MNIEINGTPIIPYKHAYVVMCKAMYGDGDGEGYVEVGGFLINKDEELLEDFIKTCERLKNAYPGGMGGHDNYDHVEGFNKWFYVDNLTSDEYKALPDTVKELTSDWPNDPAGFDGKAASFEDYQVFHYDSWGRKYHVAISGLEETT